MDKRLRYVGKRHHIRLGKPEFKNQYYLIKGEVAEFLNEEDFIKAIRYESECQFKRVDDICELVLKEEGAEDAK